MKLLSILFILTSLSVFSQEPWDGLSNEELSGNQIMHDGKGYLFNYGNNFPESDLDPTVMNCINDIGNIHNATSIGGVQLSFDSINYTDTDPFGVGSLAAFFDGTQTISTPEGTQNTTQVINKFSKNNCTNLDTTPFLLSSLEIKKVRAMIKTSNQCTIMFSFLGNDNDELTPYIKSNSFIIDENVWTVIEFDLFVSSNGYAISDAPTITGITYQVVSNNPPITLWVDWLEIGSAVGIKNIPKGVQKVTTRTPFDNSYWSGDIASDDSTGFELNFGDGGEYLCQNDKNINNIFDAQGITNQEAKTFFVSEKNSFYRDGSINFSFDGTQHKNGYVSSRFPKGNCESITENPINVSNENHRLIRAMVYSTEDVYLRIFAGMIDGIPHSGAKFIALKGGTDAFLTPTFLKANTWTEVTFNIGKYSIDHSYTADYTKNIGVTYSIMNSQLEETATPFSVDFFVDWLEIGSKVGAHDSEKQLSINNSLAGNYSAQDGTGYIFDFNTPDTTNQAIKEINCIPMDSVSNHIYNTTNIDDLQVTITKQGQEATSGALNLNFSNLKGASDWVINKFTQNDCQNMDVYGLNLTTIATQVLSGTIKVTQNANLKIALVQRTGATYTVIEDAEVMETVDLIGGVWTDVDLDLNDVLNGHIIDLTTVVGVAYQITPSTGNKKSSDVITLSIDQLKIGSTTSKDITTNLNLSQAPKLSFTAYPNPTNGVLNIHSNATNTSYELVNLLGQSVLTFTKNSQNVSSLLSGIYFLNCYNEEELLETLKIKVH